MFGSKKDIFDRLIESNKNIIVSGDISSGKTSNIIFPLIDRLVGNNENFLFLDAKEEYINKYYGYLKSNDYNIVVINLQEPDRSNGFNPLTYPYILYRSGEKDRAIEYLEVFSRNIFTLSSDDKSFWNLSACDLFIGLSILLFDNAKEEEVNINSVNNMVNSVKLKEYVEKLDKNSSIYSCLSGTILAPNDTKEGIIATFKQQLRKIISKEKLNNLLYKTTFDINNLSKDKNAIFIINRDDFRDYNLIAVIVIEQMFKIIFDNEAKVKYNFVLDNIDTLDNINNLDNMLSSGVSQDIYFTIATRSLEDFNKKYGEYINKLCNIISINNKNVEAMIDNKYDKIRYNLSAINYPKDVINYPVIPRYDIKVFTLSDIANNVIITNKKKDNSCEKEVSSVKVKKSNEKKEFVNNNPFINNQNDNIFSVYEDNKVVSDYDSDEIENLIDKINEKIKELSGVEDNDDSRDDFLDNEQSENDLNKDIKDIDEFDECLFNDSVSTDDLLKLIDDRILELEKENNNQVDDEDEFNKFVDDSFPSIIVDEKKKYVKNTLAHYDKREIIENEVERELENLGLIRIIDDKKYYMNGYSKTKNKLLREKYNIENNSNNIF